VHDVLLTLNGIHLGLSRVPLRSFLLAHPSYKSHGKHLETFSSEGRTLSLLPAGVHGPGRLPPSRFLRLGLFLHLLYRLICSFIVTLALQRGLSRLPRFSRPRRNRLPRSWALPWRSCHQSLQKPLTISRRDIRANARKERRSELKDHSHPYQKDRQPVMWIRTRTCVYTSQLVSPASWLCSPPMSTHSPGL